MTEITRPIVDLAPIQRQRRARHRPADPLWLVVLAGACWAGFIGVVGLIFIAGGM